MQRQELREVIELPASERVLYFEPPTFVDCLLDEVSGTPGALPLLSFTLITTTRNIGAEAQPRWVAAQSLVQING